MVRLGALLGLVAAERLAARCRGLEKLPMYYINLDAKVERRLYMEETWTNATAALKRVRGFQPEELSGILEFKTKHAAATYAKDAFVYLRDTYGSTPGEIGCAFSHLEAVRQAYEDGHEMAVIMEDDVSPSLCALWPAPLESFIAQADAADPAWQMIRLQWYYKTDKLNEIKRAQFQAIAKDIETLQYETSFSDAPTVEYSVRPGGDEVAFVELKKKVAPHPKPHAVHDPMRAASLSDFAVRLRDSWGEWKASDVPLLVRWNGGYGGAAVLVHRRGMRRVLQDYLVGFDGGAEMEDLIGDAAENEPYAQGEEADDDVMLLLESGAPVPADALESASEYANSTATRYRCRKKCLSQEVLFKGRHTFVTVPSLLAIRDAEEGSLIRAQSSGQREQPDRQHHIMHLGGAANQMFWLAQLAELPYPLAPDHIMTDTYLRGHQHAVKFTF